MSKIFETSKDIKKKLSLNDYVQTVSQENGELASHRAVMPVQQPGTQEQLLEQRSAKIKATYYLAEEDNKALIAIYIKRLQNNNKVDKSSLICEAIQLLYQKELK